MVLEGAAVAEEADSPLSFESYSVFLCMNYKSEYIFAIKDTNTTLYEYAKS
jgi:hypothetical protein